MTAPPVLVVRTAGTNCDAEAAHAFTLAGGRVETIHLDALLARPERLRETAILCLPGGFTYGDDVASGALFSVKLRSRLLPEIAAAVERGTLVLGICNGFQILVRSGLLPALDGVPEPGQATLGFNDSARFEARWVVLEGASDRSPWVRRGDRIACPVAHGEGKFVPRDDATMERLRAGDRIVVRYAMPAGASPGDFPWNPNGSTDDVAGLCDATGRIFGLMPHPERNVLPWHHPGSRNAAPPPEAASGIRVFENAVRWARGA
jgi:phosphoribosylformylglycinamidine synthase